VIGGPPYRHYFLAVYMGFCGRVSIPVKREICRISLENNYDPVNPGVWLLIFF
jgi:hypothetical protein